MLKGRWAFCFLASSNRRRRFARRSRLSRPAPCRQRRPLPPNRQPRRQRQPTARSGHFSIRHQARHRGAALCCRKTGSRKPPNSRHRFLSRRITASIHRPVHWVCSLISQPADSRLPPQLPEPNPFKPGKSNLRHVYKANRAWMPRAANRSVLCSEVRQTLTYSHEQT